MSSPKVEITDEEKIYPEEDMKYEGTVNNKPWKAHQTLGHGATIFLQTEDTVELFEEEEQAIYDEIWSYL
jgi:hypothetical protein